jgi:hypothetical protein
MSNTQNTNSNTVDIEAEAARLRAEGKHVAADRLVQTQLQQRQSRVPGDQGAKRSNAKVTLPETGSKLQTTRVGLPRWENSEQLLTVEEVRLYPARNEDSSDSLWFKLTFQRTEDVTWTVTNFTHLAGKNLVDVSELGRLTSSEDKTLREQLGSEVTVTRIFNAIKKLEGTQLVGWVWRDEEEKKFTLRTRPNTWRAAE